MTHTKTRDFTKDWRYVRSIRPRNQEILWRGSRQCTRDLDGSIHQNNNQQNKLTFTSLFMADFTNVFTQALFYAIATADTTRIAAGKLPLTDAQIQTALVATVQTALNNVP